MKFNLETAFQIFEQKQLVKLCNKFYNLLPSESFEDAKVTFFCFQRKLSNLNQIFSVFRINELAIRIKTF